MWKQRRGWRKLKPAALILMPVWLTSCAGAGSCELLALRDYDAAFTSKFVEQLANLAPDSELSAFVVDARALRQAVRACKG